MTGVSLLDVLDPSRADDVDLWLDRFAEAFPQVVVTLLADGAVERRPLPDRTEVRVFGEDAPWEDAVDLAARSSERSGAARSGATSRS